MAVSRFDTQANFDYNMEWPKIKLTTPNFEMWDKTLGSLQQTVDQNKLLATQKNPNYLQSDGDRQHYQQYKQEALQKLNDATAGYANGISEGQRKSRDFQNWFLQEWQPGGRAFALEDRYKSYAKAKEDIEKEFKDDKSPVNKAYAYKQLNDQLTKDINYNKDTGEYTKIATPELYKDPNIRDQALKAIKELHESGSTTIAKFDPYTLEAIKTKGITEETVNLVMKSLLNSPQYAKQQGIEAWYKSQGTDKDAYKQQFTDQLNKSVENTNKQVGDLLDKGDKGKLQYKDIVAIQQDLSKKGVSVPIDGKWGDETKNGLLKLKDENAKTADDKIKSFDFDKEMLNSVRQSYMDMVKPYAWQEKDIKLSENYGAVIAAKAAHQRAAVSQMISGMQSLQEKAGGKTFVGNDNAVAVDNFDKIKEMSNKNFVAAQTNLDNIVKATDVGKIVGTTQNLGVLLKAFKATNRGDFEAFKNMAMKYGEGSGVRMMDEPALKAAYDKLLTGEFEKTNDAFKNFEQTKSFNDLNQQSEKSLLQSYIGGKGKVEYEKLKKEQMKPDETEEQFKDRILANKNEYKDLSYSNFSTELGLTAPTKEPFYALKQNMKEEAKKDPTLAKSLNVYSLVSSSSKDIALKPFFDGLKADMSSGDPKGYTYSGTDTPKWKDVNGKDTPGDKIDFSKDADFEILSYGTNGASIKIKRTLKGKEGEGAKYVYTTTDGIPLQQIDPLRRAMEGVVVEGKNTGDKVKADVGTRVWSQLGGEDATNTVIMENTPYNPTVAQPLKVTVPRVENGKLNYKDGWTYDHKGGDLGKGVLLNSVEIKGQHFNIYRTGDNKILTTVMRYDKKTGDRSQECVMLGPDGEMTAVDPTTALTNLRQMELISNQNVETNIQKIPNGQFVSPGNVAGAVGMFQNIISNDDDESKTNDD